jgi:hypothetical protein
MNPKKTPKNTDRADFLHKLAPHLPPELAGKALAAARDIRDKRHRAAVLSTLAPHLPPHQQPTVLADALAAATAIADDDACAEALNALAPHLPPDLLPAALARAIQTEWYRTRALAALAPHLPTIPHYQQLWGETLPILAARGRSDLLSDLAALTPWLEALATPEELAAIAQSIVDVSRCWP